MQATTTAFGTQVAGNDMVVEHRIRLRLPLRRANFVLNPSAEYGVASWGTTPLAGTMSFTRSRAQVHGAGDWSFLVSWGAAATGQQLFAPTTGNTWEPGTTYTFSAWVFVPVGSAAVQVFAQGVALVTGTSSTATGVWQRLSVTFAADTAATFVGIRNAAAVTAGMTAYVDEVLVEASGTLGAYFDGDDLTAINLFENPSFEHLLMPEQWQAIRCAASRSRDWAVDGDYSVVLTPNDPGGSPGSYLLAGGGPGDLRSGMNPGRTYTVSVTMNVPAPLTGTLDTNAGRIMALWFDTADGLVHNVVSNPGPIASGGIARVALTFSLPATASEAYIRVYHGGPPGSGLVYLDAAMLRRDSVDAPYFGGRRLSDNSWTGVPGNSASRLAVTPYPDVTLACEQVQVQRSMISDMPAGTRLISGVPAATSQIKVSGLLDPTDEAKTAAWLLNPYEPTSPLYLAGDPIDADVLVEQGLITDVGAEYVTTFTGSLDSVDSDTGDGSAMLNCVDYRGKLRPTVTLPMVAYQSVFTFNNPGLSATWPVDSILRQNGFNTSPPPRVACAAYFSNHGSVWPEVSGPLSNGSATSPQMTAASCFRDLQDPVTAVFNADPSDYLALMVEGPWGRQVCKDPILQNVPLVTANRPNVNAAGSMFIEGWFLPDSSNIVSGGSVISFAVQQYGGVAAGLTLQWVWQAGATVATPDLSVYRTSGSTFHKALTGQMTLDTWHHVAAFIQFTGSTTATVKIWIDGIQSTTFVTGLTAAGSDSVATVATIQAVGWADSVQITNEPSAVPQSGFYATAYLDASLNALVATGDTTGQDPWGVMQSVAQAEQGVAGFDEHGEFRFRNRNNIGAIPSVRPVSSTASLKGGPQYSQGKSTLANHVTLPVNAMDVDTPASLFQASSVLKVAPKKSLSFLVGTPSPALIPQRYDSGYLAGPVTTPPVGTTYWRAGKSASGGTKVSTGITVTSRSVAPSTLQITIKNTNSFTVYMVSPSVETDVSAGTPYLFIGGAMATPPVGNPQAESLWQPSIDARGDVALQMPANVWVQELDSAQRLTDDIVADLARPRPIIGSLSLVHDPRLQLTDRVTVSDPNGSKMNDDVVISGLTSSDSATDWGLNVEARAINSPGDWLLGVAGRSELGTSTYG